MDNLREKWVEIERMPSGSISTPGQHLPSWIRSEAVEGDPPPAKMTEAEEDLYAVQARKAKRLLDGANLSCMQQSSDHSKLVELP